MITYQFPTFRKPFTEQRMGINFNQLGLWISDGSINRKSIISPGYMLWNELNMVQKKKINKPEAKSNGELLSQCFT